MFLRALLALEVCFCVPLLLVFFVVVYFVLLRVVVLRRAVLGIRN